MVINYMLNGKALALLLKVILIEILLCKRSYSPQPDTCSKNKAKVELDLCNNATKCDLKNLTGVGTSKFAQKVDLASLNQKLVN